MKNLVLCCDGTANEFAPDKTNVVKLFSTLLQDPGRQVAYYHPGLGTMEPPGALAPVSRRITKLLGRAFGYGLESDIRDAYVFLMNAFEPGDEVFLFGFSRGAYTVRAVASLLHEYGLIRKGNEPLVPYAIRMMTAINRAHGGKGERPARARRLGQDDADSLFRLAKEFRSTFSTTDCKPHFVGVWDTVSSVGWIENPLRLPYTANNPDIEIGRQALAIDERRAFFRPNRWQRSSKAEDDEPAGPRDLKQVWFPGVHCDVGGGYPERDSGLSKISLRWMLGEAEAAGLLLDHDRVDLVLGRVGAGVAGPDPKAVLHESLRKWWWLAEIVPRPRYVENRRAPSWCPNFGRRRTIFTTELIHESAYQRGDAYTKQLRRSLRAHDPTDSAVSGSRRGGQLRPIPSRLARTSC